MMQKHLLSDYQPLTYLIDQVKLSFYLSAEATLVHSELQITNLADTAQTIALNGEALMLLAVSLNGQALGASEYQVSDMALSLLLPLGQSVLSMTTQINPKANTALEGLYLSDGVYCTQCEAEGFRRITYFPDRPDMMTVYQVRIEADAEQVPVLLSNGNCIESGTLADGKHFAVWQDPHPKPSYLFALVAGNLVCQSQTFTTDEGREVSLEVYVKAHHQHRCQHALDSLANAMRWDEETFGLSYDLDRYMIVAVDDFNMGAMENKGLNVFNAKFVLADPATATDADYTNVDSVIAHEYFHNWTGNRVTCRNWFQLTLKEGLTVFRDQCYTEDTLLGAVKRIEDVRLLRSAQFSEDSGPLRHPIMPDSYVEMNNFYTATVYEKGAEVVRLYQTLLSKEGFRKGMDLYFSRHDGQAVTVHEFRNAMADANGVDLAQMHHWYTQAGTPVVKVDWSYQDQTLRIRLTQSLPHLTPAEFTPLLIPVDMAIFTESGQRQTAKLAQGEGRWQGSEGSLWLGDTEAEFVLTDVMQPPKISWLRHFSAPVILQLAPTLEDYLWQAMYDDDLFNRWEACQQAWVLILKNGVLALRDGQDYEPPSAMKDLYQRLLNDDQLPKAWLVEAVKLPSFDYLAQQLDTLWVEEWLAVIRQTKAWLGEVLTADWWRVIERSALESVYRFNAQAMADRALHQQALAYLAEGKDERAWAVAYEQVQAGDNMTLVQSALTLLVHTNAPQAESALALFYDRWKDLPLVVDKWFSIQAGSPQLTAQQVDALSTHPAFVWTNPNRVRSVYGVMGRANAKVFHQADGQGYALVAKRIVEIDAINPQLSARLLQAFSSWRKYPETYQQMAKTELEAIRKVDTLSKDAGEVLGYLLEG